MSIDDGLQSLNFGVHTAWRKARDRDVWHQVVSTATLHSGGRQYRETMLVKDPLNQRLGGGR